MPTSRSTAVENIADRAAGYGVPGVVVDGTDPVAVYEVMQKAVERARAGHGPTLIEAKVTRLKDIMLLISNSTAQMQRQF